MAVVVSTQEHSDLSIPLMGSSMSHEDQLKRVLEVSRTETYSTTSESATVSLQKVPLPQHGQLVYNKEGHVQAEMYERVRNSSVRAVPNPGPSTGTSTGETKAEFFPSRYASITTPNVHVYLICIGLSLNAHTPPIVLSSSKILRPTTNSGRIRHWFARMRPVREAGKRLF